MSFNLIPPAEWVDTEAGVVAMGQYLYNSGLENGVAYDTETTGLRITSDIPVMASFSDGIRRFAMMADPWLHHPWVKDGLLQNRNITKIGTNLKFDCHMSANVGITLDGPLYDTLVPSWLHNENRFGHGLKDTAKDYCGLKMVDFNEVFKLRKATKLVPAETPGDAIARTLADPEGRAKAIEYSGLDAYASHKVLRYLEKRLRDETIYENWNLWDHFLAYEVPFTRVLWNLERRGIAICTGHLKAQMGPMERTMRDIEGKIAQTVGWVVNLNSTKQLRKLFFEQLQYEPIIYTDGGKSGVKEPSTNEAVLTAFAEQGCPISKLVIEHRKTAKIYGTYIEGLLGWVDPSLRVHTTLKQIGTVTGRQSSAEPNLQNIPRAGTDKFKIREAFVAGPNKILVVADYDQLEMKLMAHFSGDVRMIEAINSGMDLHCYTVSLMFDVPYEEVYAAKKAKDPIFEQLALIALRQICKAIGFGLIYGIGPLKLAAQLSDELGRTVTKEEAQNNINRYFNIFSGVHEFIRSTHKACHETEFVQTLLGRKRRLPQINAKGGSGPTGDDAKGIVAEARRQSVNSRVQGSAADIIKAAMLRAESDPEMARLGAQLLMQIHDELIWECDDIPEIIEAVKKRAKEIMEEPFGESYKLRVGLTTEAHAGYTWNEAKN